LTTALGGAIVAVMGVLSDYFVAGADDLGKVGSDGKLPKAWPRIDCKGFGVIPLEALAKRLKAKGFEDGEPPAHGEDYEWLVMQLTPSLVKALAKLSKEDIAKHAAPLAKIEELGWSVKDTQRVLVDLNGLAKKAGDKKNVYLWTCP
jgi:hypothetical protein